MSTVRTLLWSVPFAVLATACGKVEGGESLGMVVSVPLPADEPDAGPDAAPPEPGQPDAAPPPPPPVRKWYKMADGIEHEGAPPGLVGEGAGFGEEDGEPVAAFAGGGQADAVSYVHVDWCDKPGVEATVCKWDVLDVSRETAWAECTAESKTVCGTIKFPHVLFY